MFETKLSKSAGRGHMLTGWDGHTDLHGLTGLNREEYKILQKYIPNYSINIIDPSKIEDLSCFEQDLQMIFGMLKYRKDKEQLKNYIQENKAYFEHIDEESYDAAVAMLGAGKIMDQRKEKESGKRNMCKAIDDIYKDGMMEGEIKGETKGEMKGKAESVLELLEMLGSVPDKLQDIINSQTDLNILSQWLRIAARAESVGEFECRLQSGLNS